MLDQSAEGCNNPELQETESASTDHFPDQAVSRNHFPGEQGPPNVPSDILRQWIEWLRAHGTRHSEAVSWRKFCQELERKQIRRKQLAKRKKRNRSKNKVARKSRRANRGLR